MKASISKLNWIWHRLRAMPPDEIAGRVKAKAQEWTGSINVNVLEDFTLGPADARVMRLPPRELAPAALCEAVRRDAVELRAGQWRLLGCKDVTVSDPPIWNRDEVHGVSIPAEVSDYRNLPGGGDARCAWEIARWGEMVRLAQDAWLNGELDSLRTAQRWMRDWMEKNPRGQGIHWRSPLEGALRLMNFCWIDALARACDDAELTAEQDEIAQAFVPAHAWWVWRKKSFGSSANNHLMGELAALVMVTKRWPSLAKLICCPERLWPLLEQETLCQFADDGGNKEQALHYHLFAWEMTWQAGRVMERLHGPVMARLRDAAQYFCDLSMGAWDFGDSDDAQITPLAMRREHAEREWKAWMLGADEGASLRFWLGDPPRVSSGNANTWVTHEESGHAIWRGDPWVARVDASPLGFGSLAAHGHLDAMHVSIWSKGHPLVIDPGTGGYYGDAALRARLAAWEAHNGPVPASGREVPNRAGPFLWMNHHDKPVLEFEDGSCVVRFACDGPFMRRRVKVNGELVVEDEVCGRMAHVVTWQFAPEWTVTSSAEGEFELKHPSGQTARLGVKGDAMQACEIVTNVVSPRFGQVMDAAGVRVRFTGRLVSTFSL